MKMYQVKNTISVIGFIISGFCLAMSIVCIADWQATSEAIVSFILSISYFITGICLQKGSQEDREDYIQQHEAIEKIYKKLYLLYNKYYWLLDVGSTMPALTNKKELIKWSVETSLICQSCQNNYNIAQNDKQTSQDLDIMINLIQELIDNKKYI